MIKPKEKSLEVEMSETAIRELYASCADVSVTGYTFGGIPVILIYAEGMASSKHIQQFVLPCLEVHPQPSPHVPLPLYEVNMEQWPKEFDSKVFAGELLLYYPSLKKCWHLNIADLPQRSVEETAVEPAVHGPRDGFMEEISRNVALIRKRLRTHKLCYERYTIGNRNQTPVALLYVEDVINTQCLQEVKARLKGLSLESLIEFEHLVEGLSDSTYSIFPLIETTGRPDFAVNGLENGRFVVLMEGIPLALIAPITITTLVKSPEDSYFSFYVVSLQRIIRFVGLFIALLLPGLYVALTAYTFEHIPLPMLATIFNTRLGLPLTVPMETFLVLMLFEIFREAGIRLPKAFGQTVTVVGGLIIGDAAIRAGITSPTIIVIIAITVICTYTIVNQSLTGLIGIMRAFVLFMASILGMFGFMLSLFTILLLMANLESFGVPFLAPLSWPTWKDIARSLLKFPAIFSKERPRSLRPKKLDRKGAPE